MAENENDPPRNRPWDKGDRDNDRDPPRRRDNDRDPPRRRRDEDDEDARDDDRPRRRRYEDDDFDDRPRRRGGARQDGSNGLAVAGLILGLLSFCTIGLTSIPGLICAGIALGKPTGRGMAVAGLVLSLLGALVGVGGVFYAVSSVRTAAARMSDQNNMKQIGLGMHFQHDRTGGFTQYAQDARGRVYTDHSFRVGLLPHIEQDNLFRQFDLAQPWDAPANRSASNTPIKTYTTPFDGAPSVNTPYRGFVGGGALFNDNERLTSMISITDGTSNTIMLVHAAEQVPWAAPRELKYSPTGPLPKLGHPAMKGGSNVLMADGSVRFVRDTIPDRTMRALITRAEGEIITNDW